METLKGRRADAARPAVMVRTQSLRLELTSVLSAAM
jgi:hypothetical protein